MKVCMSGGSKQVLHHGFLGVRRGPFSFGQGSALRPQTQQCATPFYQNQQEAPEQLELPGSRPLAIAPTLYGSSFTTHNHVTSAPCSWPLQTRKTPQVQQLWGCSDPDNLPLQLGPCQDHLNRDPFYTSTLEKMVVSRQVPVNEKQNVLLGSPRNGSDVLLDQCRSTEGFDFKGLFFSMVFINDICVTHNNSLNEGPTCL